MTTPTMSTSDLLARLRRHQTLRRAAEALVGTYAPLRTARAIFDDLDQAITAATKDLP